MAVATNPDGGDLNVSPESDPSTPISSDSTPPSAKLIYPLDLSAEQDCISFEVLKLKNVGAGLLQDNGEFADPANLTSGFGSVKLLEVNEKSSNAYQKVPGTPTVFLPIQSGITDINTVSWGSGTLNAVERELVNLSFQAMQTDNMGQLASDSLKSAYKNLQGEGGDALRVYLAQLATGTQGLLPRVTGQVLNPNLELLFKGPELRPFQFQFQLSPREELEGTAVKSIIRFFKKFMAVRRGEEGSFFLKAPYVFRIKYLRFATNQLGETLGINLHPSIGLIKECALKSFSVDYTPLGSYATYDDESRTMVSYKISMDFQEISTIYQEDYDYQNMPSQLALTDIGY